MFGNYFRTGVAVLSAAIVIGSFASEASATTIAPGGTYGLDAGDLYTVTRDFEAGDVLALDLYTFDVAPGALPDPLPTKTGVGVVFPDPAASGDIGIADLKFEWKDGGASVASVTITDSDGLWDFVTTAFWVALDAGKTYTLEVTGIVLSNGGQYSLAISAVPLPAAGLLFGTALLAGGFLRRRKMMQEFAVPA